MLISFYLLHCEGDMKTGPAFQNETGGGGGGMELEERYANLIDYLTDYIYTVRIQDGVAVETYHGPGCVAITGYTSEDYRANPDLWSSMVPRADREKVLEQARRALAGERMQP